MPTVEAVHAAVWAKLQTAANVNVYDGEIVDADGEPTTPPLDPDKRVHPYAVLYASPGRLYAGALNGVQSSRDTSFQVTCTGGDPQRATWCADKVCTALLGPVTVSGQGYQIRVYEDDPGTVRRDDDKVPPRHYVPVLFRLHAP